MNNTAERQADVQHVKLSDSIELRAPVDLRESGGEYMRLQPGSDEPQLSKKLGGYFRVADPNTTVVWLGRSNYGDTPGAGVVGHRGVGGIGAKYWVAEWRASPLRWDAEELLVSAAPAVRRAMTWIDHFLSGAQVIGGRIMSADSPMDLSETFTRGEFAEVRGQTSGWLANGDGGLHVVAPAMCAYIRRDELLRYLTGCDWPHGSWARAPAKAAARVLDNGEADWVGVIEAQPPVRGLLQGANTRNQKRRLWSAAEILAWGADGWDVQGAWIPEKKQSAPRHLAGPACAPMHDLAAFHLFHDGVFVDPLHFGTLAMAWLSSRGRALVAPAAKALDEWAMKNPDAGARVYGQKLGGIYMAALEDSLADAFAVIQQAQPLMAIAGNDWRRAEAVDSEVLQRGSDARANIQAALDSDEGLPSDIGQDLLSFGTTEQLLAADAMALASASVQ